MPDALRKAGIADIDGEGADDVGIGAPSVSTVLGDRPPVHGRGIGVGKEVVPQQLGDHGRHPAPQAATQIRQPEVELVDDGKGGKSEQHMQGPAMARDIMLKDDAQHLK